MKNTQIILFIFFFSLIFPTLVLGQQKPCDNYVCVIGKVKKAFKDKNYREAFKQLESAEGYDNKNIAEIANLRKQLFNAVEKEKEFAKREKLKADEATKKAEIEAQNAKREKLKADEATKQAQIQKEAAERNAFTAENLATAALVSPKNPTLALRMLEYNLQQNPYNKPSILNYFSLINDTTTSFYIQDFKEKSLFWGTLTGAVAMNSDGSRVLTSSRDNTAKLWDKTSSVLQTFVGHKSDVKAVALSGDGKLVLTGSDDKTAKLWDAQTGKELQNFIGHTDDVHAVALSGNGQFVLTSSGKTAKLWDAQTGKELQKFIGHTDDVNAVSLSGNGQFVLTSNYKTAKLWDAQTGKELQNFIVDSYLRTVALSSDGKLVLTGNDKTAKLWDAQTGKELQNFIGHISDVNAVALSSDGKLVLTGSDDNTAKLWDAETGKVLRNFVGHTSHIKAVALSSDGKLALTASSDETEKLWATETDHVMHNFVGGNVLSGDGKRAVGDFLELWDTETGKVLQHSEHKDFDEIALSWDGKLALTSSYRDSTAKLWDTETGKVLRNFLGHTGRVRAVALSADGKRVLTSSRSEAKLWDAETGKILREYPGYEEYISAIAISSDGKRVLIGEENISGGSGNTILWEVKTEKVLGHFLHGDKASYVALNSDGSRVLTVDQYSKAELWDVKTGKVIHELEGNQGEVNAIAISSDGKRVLISSDSTTKLWDADMGRVLRTFDVHHSKIYSTSMSGDGKRVLINGNLWCVDGLCDKLPNSPYKFSFFDLKQAGLVLSDKDTPQYIEDVIAYIAKSGKVDTVEVLKIAQEHLQDDHKSLSILKNKLGLKPSEAEEYEAKRKKDPQYYVLSLLQEFADETDSLNRYKLYDVLIDTLKGLMKTSPNRWKDLLVIGYNSRASDGLLFKKFKQSEQDANAGIKLDSSMIHLHINLAHSKLLQGKFKEAQAGYEKWKDKKYSDNGLETFRDVILNDFNKFEKADIIPPTIRACLKFFSI
jgi:WD40 repeat protein